VADRTIKRHDTAVLPRMRALDDGGTPLDLTSATVVYTLRNRATGALAVERGAVTLANQTTNPGEAYYVWRPGDTDTAGEYEEEWEITYPDTRKETLPVRSKVLVTILEDYDNI